MGLYSKTYNNNLNALKKIVKRVFRKIMATNNENFCLNIFHIVGRVRLAMGSCLTRSAEIRLTIATGDFTPSVSNIFHIVGLVRLATGSFRTRSAEIRLTIATGDFTPSASNDVCPMRTITGLTGRPTAAAVHVRRTWLI